MVWVSRIEPRINVAAKPAALNIGSTSNGTFLAGALLCEMTGVKMTSVVYKGGAQALVALMSGEIEVGMTSVASSLGPMRSGKLRMLATTTEKRVLGFPDIPAMDEIVPGVSGSLWYGVSAPAKTPQAVIDRLQADILSSIHSSDMQTSLTGIGMTPVPLGSEEFVGFIQNEMRKWGPMIRAGNIRVD